MSARPSLTAADLIGIDIEVRDLILKYFAENANSVDEAQLAEGNYPISVIKTAKHFDRNLEPLLRCVGESVLVINDPVTLDKGWDLLPQPFFESIRILECHANILIYLLPAKLPALFILIIHSDWHDYLIHHIHVAFEENGLSSVSEERLLEDTRTSLRDRLDHFIPNEFTTNKNFRVICILHLSDEQKKTVVGEVKEGLDVPKVLQ